jgi:hypothetical protein
MYVGSKIGICKSIRLLLKHKAEGPNKKEFELRTGMLQGLSTTIMPSSLWMISIVQPAIGVSCLSGWCFCFGLFN